MKKVRLNLEALEVESFRTAEGGAREAGTVLGRESLRLCSGEPTCRGYATCLGDMTCASACSWTYGEVACKTAGPCCSVEIPC